MELRPNLFHLDSLVNFYRQSGIPWDSARSVIWLPSDSNQSTLVVSTLVWTHSPHCTVSVDVSDGSIAISIFVAVLHNLQRKHFSPKQSAFFYFLLLPNKWSYGISGMRLKWQWHFTIGREIWHIVKNRTKKRIFILQCWYMCDTSNVFRPHA